jgi:hypothetical protein
MFAGMLAKMGAKFGGKAAAGLLFKSWMTYAVIAVAAAFVALWAHDRYLHNQIHDTENGYITQVAQSTIVLNHCRANGAGLLAQIKEQNDSIENFAREGDKLKEDLRESVININELNVAQDVWLARVDGEQVEKTCAASMSYLLKKAIEAKNE